MFAEPHSWCSEHLRATEEVTDTSPGLRSSGSGGTMQVKMTQKHSGVKLYVLRDCWNVKSWTALWGCRRFYMKS